MRIANIHYPTYSIVILSLDEKGLSFLKMNSALHFFVRVRTSFLIEKLAVYGSCTVIGNNERRNSAEELKCILTGTLKSLAKTHVHNKVC